ncbi:cyclin-dependent protein kinase inhibitor SMR1-like [Phoenix dactylifera]|uniref:Cyclin-dependent protein kinase inhibitor SMR1-like n=1 Tax=Phoenix dactylifera TaxID=42345 RepID=A0A8B7CP90_PHODC|nr:cyclin-dependent protein kinase inhibitor SMR1-like [Phoenix dactylifera]
MSASPDFSGVPPELVLRPIVTVFPIEDRDDLSSLINGKDGVDECRTPTSEESKIPPVPSSCPPAPKKPRQVLLCKRRLSELELFGAQVEEIELWFRQRDRPATVPSLSCRSKKRKRRCLGKK